MFLEHQINVLQWFLKDHKLMLLMAAGNVAFPSGINYILTCILKQKAVI